ncbi:D-2-hydroxyacid dehydrogenase family protein [Pluralibacter gergoviae]
MSKYKCVILDDYQNSALKIVDWSVLDDVVETVSLNNHISDQSELLTRLNDANIVIAMRERTPLRDELLQQLPNLKLIITTGMRNASIDMAACHNLGITVCGTQSSSQPPAELTWGLLLALARNIVPEANNVAIYDAWQKTIGTTLHGKTIGIIGLGKIGKQIAKFATAFGMHVYAWSPNLTLARAAEEKVNYIKNKDDLLKISDIVTLHLVCGPSTQGIISLSDFSIMKSTALLINTSRAALIEEGALLKALQEKMIAGAAIDVYEDEPLSAESAYRNCPNLLATPHLGYVTDTNYVTYYTQAIENISGWIKNTPVRILN